MPQPAANSAKLTKAPANAIARTPHREIIVVTLTAAALRGLLCEAGSNADVGVFNPDTVAPKSAEVRADLPGDAWRLYGEADSGDCGRGIVVHEVTAAERR